MCAGIETKHLSVEHVRQPGKRVPVRGVKGCKSPQDPLDRETGGNYRVLIYVDVIVKIDEIMVDDLPINRDNREDQTGSDQQIAPVDS